MRQIGFLVRGWVPYEEPASWLTDLAEKKKRVWSGGISTNSAPAGSGPSVTTALSAHPFFLTVTFEIRASIYEMQSTVVHYVD